MQQALTLHEPRVMSLSNEVHQTRATLLEPRAGTDHVHKFTSGLATSVHLVATIENLEDMRDVHVMVRYPDQQLHYVRPNPGNFRRLSPLRHRLAMDVVLSHTLWSEAASVQLSVVLAMNMEDQIISADSRDKGRSLRSVQITSTPVSIQIQPTIGKK